MTDSGTPSDLASLESLEPLEPLPGAAAAAPTDDPLAAQRGGLPAPGYNVYCRDKAFYRFLFAGVVILVGCCLPFSAEIARAGYQTMSGGFYTVLAIAVIWSWWGAIANNKPGGIKWLLLCMFPLIGTGWHLVGFDAEAAYEAAVSNGWLSQGAPHSASWGELFSDIGSTLAKDAEAPMRVENFWRLLGPGTVLVFLGALLAELGFIMGVVGGAKQNKQATKEKMMKAAERRRR